MPEGIGDSPFMLLRALRKRRSGNNLSSRAATKLYVVTPSSSGRGMHVGEVLRHYPRVVLLDTLDDTTALVQMSDSDRLLISRQHPEWAIEPNISYGKIAQR